MSGFVSGKCHAALEHAPFSAFSPVSCERAISFDMPFQLMSTAAGMLCFYAPSHSQDSSVRATRKAGRLPP